MTFWSLAAATDPPWDMDCPFRHRLCRLWFAYTSCPRLFHSWLGQPCLLSNHLVTCDNFKEFAWPVVSYLPLIIIARMAISSASSVTCGDLRPCAAPPPRRSDNLCSFVLVGARCPLCHSSLRVSVLELAAPFNTTALLWIASFSRARSGRIPLCTAVMSRIWCWQYLS